MNNMENVVNQVRNLPTLPTVVERIITMVENPETSSSDLAKAISSDSALVSKILKVVNSVYYGLPRKISTPTQAIVVLGFNTIKNLVVTATVFTMFDNNTDSKFDRKKFWEHSLGCAVASKVLSKRIRLGVPEEAFVAGLIHDIGKIVLDQFLHEKFEEVLSVVHKKNISIQKAEKEVLGTEHTQIGDWLCEKWNFPRHIQEAVSYHHMPKMAEKNRKLVAIVNLANSIVKLEGIGYSGDNQSPNIDLDCWNRLNIPEQELSELISEIHAEFKKSYVFFEIIN